MRSLLFVPADSERKQARGLASGADALILDLEDSVALDGKARARGMAAGFLAARPERAPQLYVRVNDFSTGLTEDDLRAVVPARPDGIMLPKSNGGPDVERLAALLRVLEAEAGLPDGGIAILPIVTETAAGVLATASYAKVLSSRLAGLTWGAEDLAAAIGAHRNRDATGRYTDVFRLARALTVLGAAEAGVSAIDTVFVDFRDDDGLRRECGEAERDGFTGKMAIHPDQVDIINAVFTPSTDAVAAARAIVEAFAQAGNPGVIAMDGKMVDRPHLRGAERLLARAKASHQTD